MRRYYEKKAYSKFVFKLVVTFEKDSKKKKKMEKKYNLVSLLAHHFRGENKDWKNHLYIVKLRFPIKLHVM